MEIGKRLAQVRETKGLTQESLARAAGWSVAHLSKVERGIHAPNLEPICRIARYVGMTLDELVYGADGAAGVETAEAELISQARAIVDGGNLDPNLVSRLQAALDAVRRTQDLDEVPAPKKPSPAASRRVVRRKR